MAIKQYITTRIENHRIMGDRLYAETRDLVEKPIYAQELLKRYQPNEGSCGKTNLCARAIETVPAK